MERDKKLFTKSNLIQHKLSPLNQWNKLNRHMKTLEAKFVIQPSWTIYENIHLYQALKWVTKVVQAFFLQLFWAGIHGINQLILKDKQYTPWKGVKIECQFSIILNLWLYLNINICIFSYLWFNSFVIKEIIVRN